MPVRRALVPACLLSAALLAGCGPDAAPTAPAPLPGGAAVATLAGGESIQRRLERAADGLLYTSESDYPFEFFAAPAAVDGPLTIASFRHAVGLAADSAVDEISLDAFFARHIEGADPNDPVAQELVPRYERLKSTLERAVRHPRVFRVGQILIRCYVVGTDAAGNVVGLTTFAVET